MRFDIVSANPKILESSLKHGLISRAENKSLISTHIHNLRDFAEGKYKQIDDIPYGGGTGMILKPEPFFRCIISLLEQRKYDEIIYLSPQGRKFNQPLANELSLRENLLLICGHYKGIDERVIKKFVTMEISIGNYVLSCGDIASLVVIDAVARLIPGTLGDGESAITDSFQVETGFDFPQYTRPAVYERLSVPKVLLSGNHKEIDLWRSKKAKTKFRKIKKINKDK
ncbi:MAG: tRNA (guanosine(37)-N1)-methyltransferase TrmD [Ignavibacteria bacterium]|nr:tRNA (guanosine(37)-N1)-methyltransferase TrmD [Ignavibacteria bacterium]